MSAACSSNPDSHEGAIYGNIASTVVRLEHIRDNYCQYSVMQCRCPGQTGIVLSPTEAFKNAFVLLADSEREWRSRQPTHLTLQ